MALTLPYLSHFPAALPGESEILANYGAGVLSFLDDVRGQVARRSIDMESCWMGVSVVTEFDVTVVRKSTIRHRHARKTPDECRLCTSKSESVGIYAVPKTVVLAGRV
jgi:hypothetical protein